MAATGDVRRADRGAQADRACICAGADQRAASLARPNGCGAQRRRDRYRAAIGHQSECGRHGRCRCAVAGDRRSGAMIPLPPSTRIFLACGATDMRSEEHTSELQSLMRISYAVFCLKKKKKYKESNTILERQPQICNIINI